MDSITIDIPKYQVDILAQKGATIVNQGGNSYSMSEATLSTFTTYQCQTSRVYRSNLNGESKPTYLLNAPTSGYNEAYTNPSTRPFSGFSTSFTSLEEHNGDVDYLIDSIGESDDPYNLREVIYISHETFKICEYPSMVEDLT